MAMATTIYMLAISCILLLYAYPASVSGLGSYPDLDPSELEALGLSEEEILFPASHQQKAVEEQDEGGEENNAPPPSFSVYDPDVVVLSGANFSEFVASNSFVMVEFYAPWCGHCKALAPEYAAAATQLKHDGVVLAKVDATASTDLAEQYGVDEYPTIFFFIEGKHKVYPGGNTRSAIVTWVRKKLAPSVTKITSIDDAYTILETGNTVAVAFFDKSVGPELQEFEAVARQEDGVLFYQTQNEDVAEIFGIKKGHKSPALVLLKNVPEKSAFYDGAFQKQLISEFVIVNKVPLVSTFNQHTASDIFESTIKKQLILFASPEAFVNVLPVYEEAAKSFKGKLVFVHVDTSTEDVGIPVAEYFGVDANKTSIVAYTVWEEPSRKFLFEDDFTVDKIKNFATGFLNGNLKEYYKSAPVPVVNDGDVKIVVGKSFDEIVLDESKDVLLEIYAPWCGFCQAFESTYNKLAKALKGIDSLIIAKMDGTANEHPKAKADGYPTLLFFPAGNKRFDPVTVGSERTVKDLYQFLKKNVGIPFTLAKGQENKNTKDVNYQVNDEL